MADIELVIKISESRYRLLQKQARTNLGREKLDEFAEVVLNGTPLPKGHGRLKDVDKFLEKVKKDREHEIYMRSWTADMVLERLDSWHAPTIIEADKAESEGEQNV